MKEDPRKPTKWVKTVMKPVPLPFGYLVEVRIGGSFGVGFTSCVLVAPQKNGRNKENIVHFKSSLFFK